MAVMTHQTLSLEKYWKLFPATLITRKGFHIYLEDVPNLMERTTFNDIMLLKAYTSGSYKVSSFSFLLINALLLGLSFILYMTPQAFSFKSYCVKIKALNYATLSYPILFYSILFYSILWLSQKLGWGFGTRGRGDSDTRGHGMRGRGDSGTQGCGI